MEADQRLIIIEKFNAGVSMSIIAAEHNTTRGAVSGLISRARNGGVGKDIVKAKRPNGAVEARPKIHNWAKPKMERPKMVNLEAKEPKRIRLRVVESDCEVTFEQLEFHHCHYPLGDPRAPTFRFCGKHRRDDKTPYCVAHCAIVFTPLVGRFQKTGFRRG